MTDTRLTRAVSLGLVVLLTGLGLLAYDRARRQRFDFAHFYLDARYVWEHGALNPRVTRDAPAAEERQLPFYLPAVPVLLAPVAAFGPQPAALLWAAAQVAALGAVLRVLRRWAGRGPPETVRSLPSATALPPPASRSGSATGLMAGDRAFALALLLALPALIEAARFNQVSFFVLALLIGAVHALEHRRPRLAGVAFAAAAVLKLLPVLFLPWLLLKRRWSAAAAMVITGAALTVLPPLVCFGPQRTVDYYREWVAYNIESARGLLDPTLPEHFLNHRNQSITQVLARLAWAEHPYPLPLPHRPRLAAPPIEWAGRAIAAGLLAALWWCTRRPWDVLTEPRRRAEAAVYALALLVVSPLVRQYYLVWALPAVVLLARGVAGGPGAADEVRATWGRPRAAVAGLVVWTVGMALWLWPMARLWGAHLVMLIVLAGLLLTASDARGVAGGQAGGGPRADGLPGRPGL